jgi:2-dehydropantoate 2-reductase
MAAVTGDVRMLVVGAGGTGGYFGGRLAEAGRDVTFLVRPRRAEQLGADGLQLVSEHGDVTVRPSLLVAGQIEAPYDLVMVTVKAFALDQAMVDFAPAVGPDTLILPTLNGLSHIDTLVAEFGERAVLGGVCVVSSMLDERGRVVQLAGMQELTYGDRGGVDSAQLTAVDDALHGAGFTARLSARITAAMWQKWVMLSSLGAFNCLMRGTVGEIIAVPGGLELANDLLAETAGVAAAAGFALPEPAREYISTLMTTPGSTFSSSMYRDLLAGNRVEVDAIIGDLVRRAADLVVPVPLLSLALLNLSIYQAGR